MKEVSRSWIRPIRFVNLFYDWLESMSLQGLFSFIKDTKHRYFRYWASRIAIFYVCRRYIDILFLNYFLIGFYFSRVKLNLSFKYRSVSCWKLERCKIDTNLRSTLLIDSKLIKKFSQRKQAASILEHIFIYFYFFILIRLQLLVCNYYILSEIRTNFIKLFR